jgi:hypothetical protein
MESAADSAVEQACGRGPPVLGAEHRDRAFGGVRIGHDLVVEAVLAGLFDLGVTEATTGVPTTPMITLPVSVLCRMSGETILHASDPPICSASQVASCAVVARPSPGVGIP